MSGDHDIALQPGSRVRLHLKKKANISLTLMCAEKTANEFSHFLTEMKISCPLKDKGIHIFTTELLETSLKCLTNLQIPDDTW